MFQLFKNVVKSCIVRQQVKMILRSVVITTLGQTPIFYEVYQTPSLMNASFRLSCMKNIDGLERLAYSTNHLQVI